MSPLRTARSFAKTAQPEAELRSPLRSAGLGSPVRRPPAPPAGAAFDPARPIFDPARPGLYVCHRSERPKILGAHTCAEYRGVFRSIAQALTKAQPGDTVHVSGGVYDESLAIAISVLIRALPGEEVVLRSAAAGDTSLVSSEAPFARLERISLEHSGGDPALRGPDGPRCVCVRAGELHLDACTLTSSTGSGVMARHAGAATLRGCRVAGAARCGVICLDGGRAACEDTVIAGCRLNGVDVQSGSAFAGRRCAIEDSGQTGLLVSDPGSTAALSDSAVRGAARRGVTAQAAGAVALDGVEVTGADMGVFVLGPESSAAAAVVRCAIHGNRSGAIFIHGAGATLRDNATQGRVTAGAPDAPASPRLPPPGRRLSSGEPSRSPVIRARRAAAAAAIQGAWRGRGARAAARAALARRQLLLRRDFAASRRAAALAPTPARAGRGPPPAAEAGARAEGMAALEADLRETLGRFDRLEARMGAILADAEAGL